MDCLCCGDEPRQPGSRWCLECERELNGHDEPESVPRVAWWALLAALVWAIWRLLPWIGG